MIYTNKKIAATNTNISTDNNKANLKNMAIRFRVSIKLIPVKLSKKTSAFNQLILVTDYIFFLV
ncbi:MAG: hypothetical protein A3F72_16975 [Bacteroidetes bacterium RIFCSPLOWO2_12_FULL_35_15]|nr:MAG: hypothetical protein A3F72_16975 [Bacteroidetes bacterium RIFCSPLOWO2_12_FULL_35_15]